MYLVRQSMESKSYEATNVMWLISQ
jgi:hypothetical protein